MSRYVVTRNGTGALHIALPTSLGHETICGKRLAGPKVITWRAGTQATAVWKEWRQCGTCADLDRKWRKK